MKKSLKTCLYIGLTIGGIVLADQATKILIAQSFQMHESMEVIRHFFNLTYTRNPGAAFGFLSEEKHGFWTLLFPLISSVALLFLGYFVMQTPEEDLLSLIGLSLIIGGAIGNFIDRLRLGEVIDFLDFYVGTFHWWIFNIADSCITVGIFLLLFKTLFQKQKGSEAPS